MGQRDAGRLTNSLDSDQTPPSLFAQAYLSENKIIVLLLGQEKPFVFLVKRVPCSYLRAIQSNMNVDFLTNSHQLEFQINNNKCLQLKVQILNIHALIMVFGSEAIRSYSNEYFGVC